MAKSKNEIKEEIFANPDLTAYSDYVANTGEIIANVIAGAPTLTDLTPMLGVKANTTAQLNILSTSVTWSNGNCVSTATGESVVLDPRTVAVKRLSDRELLCLDLLDAKLPMIQSAGAKNEELPFGALYMDLKVKENAKELEKLAWQGSTSLVSGNLSKADGFLKIADGEIASLAYHNTFATFTVSNAITVIQEALANRSEVMYEMDNLVIFMDQPKYAILNQAIIAAYGVSGTGAFVNAGVENQTGVQEMIFPGTNVRVRATHGLNGNGSIFMTNLDNLRYATDMESDKESVELFFDKYHKQLVSDIVFAIGFQYQFPENVVYLEYAPVVS